MCIRDRIPSGAPGGTTGKPEDKMEYIKKEQQAGKLVAMMGDGTNDAPALAQANVEMCIRDSGDSPVFEAKRSVVVS